MAELKTKPNDQSVEEFLNSVEDERKRKDSYELVKMMREVTGAEPKMWGDSIIGFGNYRYKSERTGREGDWFLNGFSPRKQAISLYLMGGKNPDLMEKLGKYKMGKGCLYVKKLEDVDKNVLRQLVKQSAEKLMKK